MMICILDGCSGTPVGRGLCQKHYSSAKYHGTLEDYPKLVVEKVACAVPHCDRDAETRGWCHPHYASFKRTGDPIGVRERRRLEGRPMCSTDGCTDEARARGMCQRHYQNTLNYGHAIPKREWPLLERLADTGWTVTESGCWEWNGKRNDSGYGLFSALAFGYEHSRVHRIMYQIHNSDLAPGQLVRHRCDNPPCCNPDHLEPGTNADNMRDMSERGRSGNLWENNENRCLNGHDMSLAGASKIVRQRGRKPYRACRVCAQNRSREYERRKRARLSGLG